MLKKLFLSVIFVIASASLYAQSNIDVTYENIDKIVVDGEIILNIHPSSDDKVKLSGSISTTAYAEFSMKEKKGELVITRKTPMSFKKENRDSLVINLYIKEPNDIEAKSKSDIRFTQEFTMDSISLEASSHAVIFAFVSVENCYLNANANGKIVMSGKSTVINARAVGSGSVNAVQVECETAIAISATNGECYVKATKLLNLKATTYGNVFYKGKAEEIIKNISTFGHIESF